jgi:2-oxoglutarate dehydrogenase E2 component (dihydrolipoamide succinyltransferase)
MATEIKIPALGESVAGGMIAKWHFNDGDVVKVGDVLLTLETDKVAAEVTAEATGALTRSAQEGDEVEVGSVVGSIDESKTAAEAPTSEPEAPAKAEAEPKEEKPKPVPTPAKPEEKPANVTEFKVPVVEPSAAAASTSPEGQVTRRKMSPLRRKIAAQLVSAQQTAALLTTFNECDMSAVMAMRKALQEGFVAKHGVKLGFMSFFVKAVVEALQTVPQINVRVEGEEIVEQHYYDIGVAVGTEKGLVVPVLRGCYGKDFAQLEKDILDYAGKAREGKLQLADLTGGVFTISNGGVYGSLLSTPILNPPQSGILGMHTIQQRPVAVNGQVEIRPMMNLALTYDHRVVDGKEAVTFLIRVKECIENPARMLVGA